MAIPYRRAVGVCVLLVLSGVLAAAFLALWPKPLSAVLAGAAGLCLTATLLVLYVWARQARQARGQLAQFRNAIILQPGLFALAFLGIAWKYYRVSPAFSSASLVSAGLFGLGAVTAFFITQWVTPSTELHD